MGEGRKNHLGVEDSCKALMAGVVVVHRRLSRHHTLRPMQGAGNQVQLTQVWNGESGVHIVSVPAKLAFSSFSCASDPSYHTNQNLQDSNLIALLPNTYSHYFFRFLLAACYKMKSASSTDFYVMIFIYIFSSFQI